MRYLALVLLAGCQIIVDVPDVTLDPCLASANGEPRPGPEMVSVDAPAGGFCIDSTEVTVAQFNDYLIASGQHVNTPPVCDTAIPPPLVDSDPTHANLPVGTVGVCDAWSYCEWAGKRLCGALGGGSARNLPTAQTEWGFACINGQRNTPYPYGTTYDATVCATDVDAAANAGSTATCHGIVAPFDRIFDMSGNREEVVNDLEGGESIAVHGGNYTSGMGASCDSAAGLNGFIFSFEATGFRCCSDR